MAIPKHRIFNDGGYKSLILKAKNEKKRVNYFLFNYHFWLSISKLQTVCTS